MRSLKLKAPSVRIHKGSGFEIDGQTSNSQLGVAKIAYKQGAKQAFNMIAERMTLQGMEGIQEILSASKSSTFYEEIETMRLEGVQG
tara:strand:+ start:191 stop:451 length:261 start_codon:yes stop_codon:yes gene_type:complete